MKINFFLILNIFILFTSISYAKDDFYFKNVILLEKDVIIPNTIDDIIYKETQSAIDFLVYQNVINTVPKSKWIVYKQYLTDLDNKEKLNSFFLITKVWGVIDINISEKEDLYLIQLRLFDTFDDYFYIKEFSLSKYDLLNNLVNYKEFVIENITKYFKKINIKEYSEKLSKKRDSIKGNKDFEVLLSSGSGFIMARVATDWQAELGFGLPVYMNFDFSFKNFYLSTGISYFSIFNQPLKIRNEDKIIYDNEKIFTFLLSPFLEAGGWFYNRFFSFSFGIRYNFSKIFELIEERGNNYKSYFIDFNYSTLFFYLKFIFSPIKSLNLSLRVGSFLSPSNIFKIFPNFFPFYIDANFKYFFYKDTFIEIIFPFWMESFKRDNDEGESPIFRFILEIGIGYRFKWDRKIMGEK